MSEAKEIPIEIETETETKETPEPETGDGEDTIDEESTGTDDAPAERTIETLEAELEALKVEFAEKIEAVAQAEREQYETERERLLRTAADAENTKKRLESETQKRLKYANESLIGDLIPVLDSLAAAIKSADGQTSEDSTTSDSSTFSEGVQLVHKQLLDILKTRGLTPIEAVGKTFDPNQHEAVFATESTEVPEGDVVEEFRGGYLLHERVIRAAQVVVSKGHAEKPEPTPNTDEQDTENGPDN